MRAMFLPLLVALLLPPSFPAVAAEADGRFERGLAAYEAGAYDRAFDLWRPLAEAGQARAQYRLGRLYDRGEGVGRDYRKAVRWYRKAAEAGLAEAQYNLGHMYASGDGVDRNLSQAAAWYRKAAEQGDGWAQYNLGVMYELGRGVERNVETAAEWYRQAALQGEVNAQVALGMLLTDKGLAISARPWFKKAASEGNKLALTMLALEGDDEALGRLSVTDWACVLVMNILLRDQTYPCE